MKLENIKGEVRKNEPLSKHTSFCLGGPADALVYPSDRNDLIAVLQAIKTEQQKFFVLGSGTNLLVRDGGFRGVVVCLKKMNEVVVEREYRSVGGSYAVLRADAGAPLAKVLAASIEAGVTGMEFAAGIPGTVGGAVRMNAGTAIGEIGDVIESVTFLSPDGETVTRNREELKFSYRSASIPEGHIIIEARVALRRDDKEKISTRVLELLQKRKDAQPQGIPNAGSIFKNPKEKSAGFLIESAGMKGKIIGGAQISEKHANFIVGGSKARAADVLALMEMVKARVLDVHGVRLEPEIKIIGEE